MSKLLVLLFLIVIGFYDLSSLVETTSAAITAADTKTAAILVSGESPYHRRTLENENRVILAGGCFWCMEEAFQEYLPGLTDGGDVVSGYAATNKKANMKPTYYAHDGNVEAISFYYNPKIVSLSEIIAYYMRNVDPLDPTGQFCDHGESYKAAVFYFDESQRVVINETIFNILEKQRSVWFGATPRISILPFIQFIEAEDYHQSYYIKNPDYYHYYKDRCGRVQRLVKIWGLEQYNRYHKKVNGSSTTNNNKNGVDDKYQQLGAMPAPMVFGIIMFCLVLFLVIVALCVVYRRCYQKQFDSQAEGISLDEFPLEPPDVNNTANIEIQELQQIRRQSLDMAAAAATSSPPKEKDPSNVLSQA